MTTIDGEDAPTKAIVMLKLQGLTLYKFDESANCGTLIIGGEEEEGYIYS